MEWIKYHEAEKVFEYPLCKDAILYFNHTAPGPKSKAKDGG